MLKRLRARLMTLLKQATVVVPWVVLVILATTLLLNPSAIGNVAASASDLSLPVRLLATVVLYGVIALVLGAMNPQLAKQVTSRFKRDSRQLGQSDSVSQRSETQVGAASQSQDENMPRFATDLASRKARVKAQQPEQADIASNTVSEAVEETQSIPETSSTEKQEKHEEKAPDVSESMSEDDFYAFLESVSDDSAEDGRK